MPKPLQRITIPEGGAVLVDAIGSMAIQTEPKGEYGIVLDLEGKFNKQDRRGEQRYLFAPGQVSELMADLLESLDRLPRAEREKFMAEFYAAWERSKETR